MYKLNKSDYLTIIKYYNIHVPIKKNGYINHSKVEKLAEDILANKLCKCIKRVSDNSNDKEESRSIAICQNSILKRRKLRASKFSCKKGPKFNKTKKNKKNLMKTSRKISFKNKRKHK